MATALVTKDTIRSQVFNRCKCRHREFAIPFAKAPETHSAAKAKATFPTTSTEIASLGIVITTFPLKCPSPKYWKALAVSLNGKHLSTTGFILPEKMLDILENRGFMRKIRGDPVIKVLHSIPI